MFFFFCEKKNTSKDACTLSQSKHKKWMRVESWKMSIEKSKQSVHSRGIGVINHVLPDEGQGGGREVEKQEGQGVRPCA